MSLLEVNTLINGDVKIEVLKTGGIRAIFCKNIMINQLLGNCIEGMVSNIFLRVKELDKYNVYPMIGHAEGVKFAVCENQVVFTGNVEDIEYKVYLTPIENQWFYDIKLKNTGLKNTGKNKTVDIIYAQDIGIGTQGHVLSNEAYNSQYIDHKAFNTEEYGYTICSRQNQKQSTGFPFLQQGSLQTVKSFSVDGYPFFGLTYKIDNCIAELQANQLNNRIYQYEFAYTALQSSEMELKSQETEHITFYGKFCGNIDKGIEKPMDMSEIIAKHKEVVFTEPSEWNNFKHAINVNDTLSSLSLTQDELDEMYPPSTRRHTETADGRILSFFKDTSEHIVLMDKELYTERSHGHIILTGKNDYVRPDLLASTSYIYGVFNSQIVIGNTSFNKLITNARNGLNVSKVSGQRIMIKIDGSYKLLTMPAVYEMGFNYAKWTYKLKDDIIEILCFTHLDCPTLNFEFKSKNNKNYDILVYSQVCGAQSEYIAPAQISRSENTLTLTHHESSMSKQAYKDLSFAMHINQDFNLYDDSVFYDNKNCSLGEPIMAVEFTGTNNFVIVIEGFLEGLEKSLDNKAINSTVTFEQEAKAYREWLQNGIKNFKLSIESDNCEIRSEVERFNELSMWYSHNARVHYSSPHGLEQYGGAAWGTRDVCQGPLEYFLVTQNFDVAKSILKKVYMHQYAEQGSWPQWFMFDNYKHIQSYESHGDIIVWPLKAIASYLSATKDMDILDIEVPYTNDVGFEFCTENTETIYNHIKKEIDYIKDHFIEGTHLSCYGDGDWDDTLQPANAELRSNMVSGWTVTLTYQAFREFAIAIKDYDAEYSAELEELAEKIKIDYHNHVIKDGVTAGFLVIEGDKTKYLLHPLDNETGLTYRLLPMTRSMISEMFTKEEVKNHIEIINKHLYHPDGVRLMNKTCRYNGGVNTYFMRAETAANFGREIGLQYVHAHIRYIEAMAKIGNFDETWKGLLKINPILIDTVVKNAKKRQSNCYFSSSDGEFDNRYEAMSDFDKLRDGSIGVKAGWRIYSSGSGIYLNQLISQCLGLRLLGSNEVVFDPVLPTNLDGLEFRYSLFDIPVKIRYNIKNGYGVSKILINSEEIDFKAEQNPYRSGGAVVDRSSIKADCLIELFL